MKSQLYFRKSLHSIQKNNELFLIFIFFLLISITPVYPQGEKPPESEPMIVKKLLPYDKWEKEYQNYNQRHYKESTLELIPHAIVMHYTVSNTLSSAWNTFYNGAMYDDGDVGTTFGHLSAHFIIDKDGTIYQTFPLERRCRGAYGVNHVALSIEMVAHDENSLLSNRKLINSSFRLVAYLMRQYNIPIEKVYGHYEVSEGKKRVPEYLDYGDSKYPDFYPPAFGRTDPGKEYMKQLRSYLKKAL